MEFKIDTKPSYTLITPVATTLDANLAVALQQKWTELTNTGSKNLIVALDHCSHMENNAPEALVKMHASFYENGESLVFTGLGPELMAHMKGYEMNNIINVAPTIAEAADIISMEILERDLFDEE